MNTAQLHRQQARSFGFTLLSCSRLFDALAHGQMNRHAGKVVAPAGLVRLVPHLTFDGIRPGELARLTDVSKQAVSQALAPLVEQGLVEYIDDPNDGRARMIRLTQKGGETFVHALAALTQLEKALADRVGAKKLAALFEALKTIQPVLEEWSVDEVPTKPLGPHVTPARTLSKRPSKLDTHVTPARSLSKRPSKLDTHVTPAKAGA